MSLILIGMRGAGKTAAGRRAAQTLQVPFWDSDAEIEALAQMPLDQLFAEHGQAAFRRLEREVLLKRLDTEGAVIATGGGCVETPEVLAALQAHPGVTWLRAPAALLAARVATSARPSLTGAPLAEELPAILARREPLYRRAASVEVATDGRSLWEVADALQQLWHSLTHHHLR